jgi:pimeloyl-ACP methyl ester carboxylesterase
MLRTLLAAAAVLTLAGPAMAAPQPFPAGFQSQDIAVKGAVIHVRVGGHGPAVLLLHGFGDTGDMWAPLATALVADHTVIVPDLRGMGDSSHPDVGYDKKNEGQDMAQVLDALHVQKADVVAHDIGNMVAYAFTAQYPSRVTKLALLDAPIPGVGPWDELLRSHSLWHFSFWGPDEERLVAGRERIYLDRFYDEFGASYTAVDEATRVHYAAIYARPHAIHDAFEQFKAFDQDAIDNKAFLATGGKLTMPVLAIGGDHSFGATMAVDAQAVAVNVKGVVVANSGHWLMEEQPVATIAAIQAFLRSAP